MDDPGLFQTLYTSRSLRRFSDEVVPDEAVFQLLDAAVRAPTGHNAQDWRFVVVTEDEPKRRLQAWAEEAWQAVFASTYPDDASIDALPRTQRLSIRSVRDLAHSLASVPLIVVVCGLRGRHSNPGGSHFPAIQNMLLAARGLGLGGSIFNLAMIHADELAEMLGIPDSNEIYSIVPIGYPTDRHGPVRRKPVAKVAYWNRWGEEWPYAREQPEDGWTERWTR
jgi:nitroreductase